MYSQQLNVCSLELNLPMALDVDRGAAKCARLTALNIAHAGGRVHRHHAVSRLNRPTSVHAYELLEQSDVR
jgi:hypothetical protein